MDGKAWNLCTKWSDDEAYRLVRYAARKLAASGYEIKLEMIQSGFGTAELNSDGSLSYKVGIKEIMENPHKRFSIHEALAPTVACFHEVCGHGGQWRNEAMKDDPLSRVLLLNDLACKSSRKFYGITSWEDGPMPQYFEQPHEIAAQYMALKMAQKLLSAVYDEETADKLLCEYVNLRVASGNEFIPVPDGYQMEMSSDGRKPYMKPTEPFSNMSQVYEQFQETFVKQVFDPADYKVTSRSADFVSDYINSQKWPWERIWSRNQINQLSDRLTQTYVLATAWMEQHMYGHWIRELPVFKNMPFLNVFHRSYVMHLISRMRKRSI